MSYHRYQARWHGGTVAVKQIQNPTHDPIVRSQFINETLLIAHLGNHPHIVPLIGCSLETEYLIFNYLPHGSMEQVLIVNQLFPWNPSGDQEAFIHNMVIVSQMLVDAAAGLSQL